MLKLSKDGKALMGLIATLRRELAKSATSTGYVMEVKPKTGAAPYRWQVMAYDGKMFKMLRDAIAAGIEGPQLYEPITAGFYAITGQYEVSKLLLATIAKDCLTSANKGVNCYRAHDTFYLTDGIISVGLEKISPTDKPHFNH